MKNQILTTNCWLNQVCIYLPVSMCVCLLVCLFLSVFLPVCLSLCLPVCLSVFIYVCLPAYQSVWLFACPSVCLPACSPACLSTVCLFVRLSFRLPSCVIWCACLLVCLHLPACLSVLSVCSSVISKTKSCAGAPVLQCFTLYFNCHHKH